MRLVHWHEAEAAERAVLIESIGYDVTHAIPRGRTFLKELATDPPLAVIVDLSRLPSQGRDLAVQIRKQAATRSLPLVFVGGQPGKLAPIQVLLPDASYCTWDEIGITLEAAIADPIKDPVVPSTAFAAYAGKPLTLKLGIKPGFHTVLVNRPDGFEQTLGELPAGAHLGYNANSPGDLFIWFARSHAELERDMPQMVGKAQITPLCDDNHSLPGVPWYNGCYQIPARETHGQDCTVRDYARISIPIPAQVHEKRRRPGGWLAHRRGLRAR